MQHTRARREQERNGHAQASGGAAAPTPPPAPELNDTYAKAIRANLGDIREAWLDMAESRRAVPAHVDTLHRLGLDLRDLTKPIGYRELAQAAGSLAQLCQATDKALQHPDLVKLHIDSLRTLAGHAMTNTPDDTSAQLLEALRIAVDSVTDL